MGKAKTPPLARDIDKAAAWLRAQMAAETDPEAARRLRMVFDALNRYRWMAEELQQWWGKRGVK